MPCGLRLPVITFIDLHCTCLGGEMRSSSLGVIDIDALVSNNNNHNTPLSDCNRKQCGYINNLYCANIAVSCFAGSFISLSIIGLCCFIM